jgi:hypothetical protein
MFMKTNSYIQLYPDTCKYHAVCSDDRDLDDRDSILIDSFSTYSALILVPRLLALITEFYTVCLCKLA